MTTAPAAGFGPSAGGAVIDGNERTIPGPARGRPELRYRSMRGGGASTGPNIVSTSLKDTGPLSTGSTEKDAYTSLLDPDGRPWARAIGVGPLHGVKRPALQENSST